MAIKFEATGDFSDLIAENAKYQRQVASLAEQLSKITGLSDPLGAAGVKAFRDLQRSAEQAKRAIESPGEAFVRQVGQLDQAMGRNMLTATEHARAIAKLAYSLAEIPEPTAAYGDAVENLTEQLAAGNINAAQYATAVASQKDAMDSSTGAGEKHGGMVEKLGGKMMNLAAGYFSFQAILGKVQEALAYVNQETEKAIASADGMTDSNKRLAQVATSAQDLDQMISKADELAKKYGEGRDIVRNVTFSARSEGFEGQLEKIIKYSDVVSAESQATVAGQVPNLFGGTITADQGINATLVAAERSRLTFEQIAQALPKISEGAALQGASASETMGITSVMAGHFASGDTAADRFKGLATKLSINESTKGKGILGGIAELQKQETDWQAAGSEGESPIKAFLGDSQELNVAFELLTKRMPDVRDRIAEIDKEMQTVGAGGKGALERKYDQSYDQSTETGRLNQALEQRRAAKIAEEIANEGQFAESGAKREAAVAGEKARQKDAGYTGLAQYGGDVAGRMATSVGAGEDTAAAMTRAGTDAIGGKSFGGLIGRAVLRASTLGMSDAYAVGTGYLESQKEKRQQAAIEQGEARREVAVSAKGVLQSAFTRTRNNRDTKELAGQVSQRLGAAYKTGGTEAFIQRGQEELQGRIQQVRAAGGGEDQVKVLQDSLAELQKLTALLARNATATEDLRDGSKQIPKPGASAAAGAPNGQRLGR